MLEATTLAAIAGRAPGSDAERRAALHVAGRLRGLEREAAIEAVSCWPNWGPALAVVAIVSGGASALSVSAPAAGAVLAVAAALGGLADLLLPFAVVRRAFGRRASQNVVSLDRRGREAAVVLVAHADAGRTGLVHRRGLQVLRTRLGRPRLLFGAQLHPLMWALLAVACCALMRLGGVESDLLTVIQFVPTVALIAMVALLVDVWSSPTVPGAGDNASGVAVALRVAEREAPRMEHAGLHVVVTGAQESLADGMRSFLRRHRAALPRDRTVVVNLDDVGAGRVRFTGREGPVLAPRTHRELVDVCREIAEGSGAASAAPLLNHAPSDAHAALYAGYGSITITCRDELGLAPRHHRRSDLPDYLEPESLAAAEDFCAELLSRLDRRLGRTRTR